MTKFTGKKKIGIVLLLVAVLTAIFYTPLGVSVITPSTPNGKDVLCQVTFDVNGIKSQTCNTGADCNTGAFFSFLDWNNNPSTINMLVGQRTYVSGKYTTTSFVGIGANSMTQPLESCVPKATNTITLTLKNDQNTVLDTHTVTVQ